MGVFSAIYIAYGLCMHGKYSMLEDALSHIMVKM